MRTLDVIDSELRLLVAVVAAVEVHGRPSGHVIDELLDERCEVTSQGTPPVR